MSDGRTQFYVTDDPYTFKLTYNQLSKELTLSIRKKSESLTECDIRFDSLRTRALCEFVRIAQEDIGGPLGSDPPEKRQS